MIYSKEDIDRVRTLSETSDGLKEIIDCFDTKDYRIVEILKSKEKELKDIFKSDIEKFKSNRDKLLPRCRLIEGSRTSSTKIKNK